MFALSTQFSHSNIFSDSKAFSKSDLFTDSIKFSPSNEFSKSEKFTLTSDFSKTNMFSESIDFVYVHVFIALAATHAQNVLHAHGVLKKLKEIAIMVFSILLSGLNSTLVCVVLNALNALVVIRSKLIIGMQIMGPINLKI